MDSMSGACRRDLGQVAWTPIGPDYDRIVFVYGPVSSGVSKAELAALAEWMPDVPDALDWLDLDVEDDRQITEQRELVCAAS